MDLLLIAIIVAWSFGTCFLPLREKALRTIVSVNAVLLSLSLAALAVTVLSGSSVTALGGFFLMDSLRALLALPMAIAWVVGTGAFVLWWGTSFKSGVGTRQLFCLRSLTLVGAFAGTLFTLLTDSLAGMLVGLMLTFFMAIIGVLFQITESALRHVRMFAVGCGAALGAFALGIGTLLVSGFRQTGELLLTNTDAVQAAMSGTSTLALLGVAITGFSMMWFMGLLPGLAWYRRGIASLPKGQRLVMRVMLPAALFPHALMLAGWGGEAGGLFMQKLFLVGSFFAALTLIEYLRAKESTAEIAITLMLAMMLVSMAYGPAGAIPALMLAMMLVLFGTALIIVHGGVWWKSREKMYATLMFAGVPVVSPLFVPYGLSIGYGIQMMPAVGVIATVLLVYASATLILRIHRAWSEAEPTYADLWSARLATLLFMIATLYGCWFMYADSLALVVKSVGV